MKLYIKRRHFHVPMIVLFLSSFLMGLQAQQAPGGTNYNLELWFAADKLTPSLPSHGGNVSRWSNLSPNPIDVAQATSAYQPKFISEGDIMNFQPSVQFSVAAERLVSESQKTSSNNKSYYMFAVSQLNTTSGYNTILNLNTGRIGWYYSEPAMAVRSISSGNRTTFSGNDKRKYGITGAIIPNNNTVRIFFNGNYSEGTSNDNIAGTVTNDFFVGTANNGTTDALIGNIQEIIVLSTYAKGMISDDAAARINTYLAIKYGITLHNYTYQGFTETVWAPDPNYDEYVFGIGRDDVTGLYQKQSKCYEDKNGLFTVFVDELANLNVNNKGTIPDGGYLMFGSNGIYGVGIGYAHPQDAAIVHRSNMVMKAQKTSTFDINVNIKVNHPTASYVMVSSTEDFNPANTRIYPVDANHVAKDIDINDGEYICFAVSRGEYTSPGGVGSIDNFDTELWFAADKISSEILEHKDTVTVWEDLSPYKQNAIQTNASSQPLYYREGDIMNFQPSVQFSAAAERLISESQKTTVNSKSYYMFAVSQLELPTSTGDKTIFSLNTTNNRIGWNNNTPYMTVRTYNYSFPLALESYRTYGIIGSIISNDGNLTPKRIFFNGDYLDHASDYNMITTATTNFFIGGSNSTTDNPMKGKIQEIIVISTDNKGMIPDDAAARINTYLAIKYGITLHNHTYKGLAGVVWTPDLNYDKYIFGIGRDDATGLYQKQSVCYDDKQQVFTVFVGDLADLNMYNGGQIQDGGYLMFGSNGKYGADTKYTHPLSSEISHRSQTILKAQKTSNFDTGVNIKINFPNATHVLVSSNDSFDPGNTRIYPIKSEGTAENVIINDGEYVGFATSRGNTDSPGGVASNLETEFWFAADKIKDILPRDGANVEEWRDLSLFERSIYQESSDAIPVFNRSENIMNFQPSVNFSNSARRLVSENAFANFKDRSYYVFYVSNIHDTSTGIKSILSLNMSALNIHGWDASNPVFSTEGTDAEYLSTYLQDSPAKQYGIIGGIRPNNSTTGEIYFNGNKKDVGDVFSMTERNGSFVVGSSNNGSTNGFIGDIQEIVVYSTANQGKIQATDAAKINTYLALKYGITLTDGDYIGSAGIVWDRTANAGYEYNIFGIGHDSKTALNQKQSQSFEEKNNLLTVFVGNKVADLNVNNTTDIADNTYLILGSNNSSGDLTAYSYAIGSAGFAEGTPVKDISHRSNIVWKAQKTGDIDVRFKVSYINSTHMLVSSSPDFEQNKTRVYALDKNGISDYITVNSGEYVTFAVSAGYTPGAADSTLELWLAADKLMETLPADSTNVTLWRDLSINKRDHVQNSTNTVPAFNSSNNLMNFQPSLSFGSATNTKLIGPDHFIESGKSYHVFYVSRISDASSTRSVVYAFNATGNNNNGWVSGKPYENTDGITNYPHLGNGKYYGINAVMRPNDTQHDIKMYMNGVSHITGHKAALSITAGRSIIGNSNTGTTYPFINGDIQEIIVLSKSSDAYLDEELGGELSRINTYLSLKYGITLEEGNYYNSNGTAVWDRSVDPGYAKNIFGIGRDDKLGLYQAQSQSFDDPTFIAFKGKLADLNVNNHTDLDDMSYLIFGSNGLSGVSTLYSYDLGHPFADGTILENSATHRSSTILKVQATSTFEVNMTVTYLNASNIIVSSDSNFTPGNTRVYMIGTDGIAENVKINDGDFVSFTVNNNRPGGTSYEMELWLKADRVNFSMPSDGASIASWMDVSGNDRHSIQATRTSQPKFNENSKLMNYQPAINFSTSAQRLQTQNPITVANTNKSFYVFYVSEFAGTGSSTAASVYSLTDDPNFDGWRNNTPFLLKNSTVASSIQFKQKPGAKKKYGIVGAIRPNDGFTYDKLYFNGVAQTGTSKTKMTGSASGYIGVRSGTTNPFIGNIQEIVVLSTTSQGDIDPVEVQKINTYFALKYGISLDEGDYIDSKGNIVWKRSDQGKYINKIFGLGRDDYSSLYQKQTSSYTESLFSVYVGNLENLNIYNDGKLGEREYIIFAARNSKNFWTGKVYSSGTQFTNDALTNDEEINLINNIHKVTFTNVAGNKKILNFKADIPRAEYLLVSKDETFSEETTRLYRLDDNGKVEGVEIENGEYITLATFGYGPAGVIDVLRVWLRADDKNSLDLTASIPDPNTSSYASNKTPVEYEWDVLEWKDQSEFGQHYRSDAISFSTSRRIPISPKYLSCSEEVNFQPALRFPTEFAGLGRATGPFSKDAPDHATFFIVYRLTDSDNGYMASATRQYTLGFGGTRKDAAYSRYPAMGFSPRYSGTRTRNEGGGTVEVEGSRGYKTETTALHMMHTTKAASIDGTGPRLEAEFSAYPDLIVRRAGTGWGNGFKLASGNVIGGASLIDGQFTGVIAEVIMFERELSDMEKERVNTYLALKYAMTLRKDSVDEGDSPNYNYVLSDGTIVWEGEAEPFKYFHNNVAGVFRDDASAAFVNKAKSTADGGMIMMKVVGTDGCGQGERSGLINDVSSVFWGNNGKTTTSQFPIPADVCGLQEKSDRMWLVNKTNLEKQSLFIGISAKATSAYTSVGPGYEVYFLVADSKEKLDRNEWDLSIPTFYNPETQMHETEYTFTNDTTYFRLASRALPSTCESCGFQEAKTLEFTQKTTRNPNGTWPNPFSDVVSDRESIVDLGDDFSVRVKVGFESSATKARFSSRSYPRPYKARVYNVDPQTGRRMRPPVIYNTLLERRYRELDKKMITEITPHVTGDTTNYIATAASFRIFDIDRQGIAMDDIEVYGICDGQIIAPTRTVRAGGIPRRIRGQRKDEDRYSFEKRSNMDYRAKTNYTIAHASYTDPKGHLDVYFDYPVSKIIIAHTCKAYRNASLASRTQDIGIGPITFSCPQPLPPINEDGMAFQKRANRYKDIPSCETVEYAFKILNATSYASTVKFTDTLEPGMKWSLGELKLDSVNMANAKITLSADERTLTIEDLTIAGCNSIYQFTAGAYFDESETTAKSYTNQATIDYKLEVLDPDKGDITGSLLSCDAFSPEGECSSTTIRTKDTDRPKFVQVSHTTGCFKPGKKVKVKIVVDNPNDAYRDVMFLDVGYNENFTYESGSFKASSETGIASGTNPSFEVLPPENPNDPEEITPGYFYLENFSLPSGTSVFEFTLLVPARDDLEYFTDEDSAGNLIYLDKDGNPTTNPNQHVPIPLEVNYSFDGDITGECSASAFNESGDIIIIYACEGKEYIITNRHVTPSIIK